MSTDRFESQETQDELAALKTFDSSTIAKGFCGGAAIGGTIGQNTIYKEGNIVYATARLLDIGGIVDRTACFPFIVPTGYRPKHYIYVPIMWKFSGSENSYIANCQLDPNNGYISFNYMINDVDKSKLTALYLISATWSV